MAGSDDTASFGRIAEIIVDPQENEAYVADGYVNRRVAVLDADTGKLKRYWGAYGRAPTTARWARTIRGRLARSSSAIPCTVSRSPRTACSTCATVSTTASSPCRPWIRARPGVRRGAELRYLLNSHHNGDRVSGNANVRQDLGIDIIYDDEFAALR
ncbi:MAG: hypothetical protein HY657_11520 [Acidobacteria bacterium]|nr:hypothetical protein [Acidobacteriota bacterium]